MGNWLNIIKCKGMKKLQDFHILRKLVNLCFLTKNFSYFRNNFFLFFLFIELYNLTEMKLLNIFASRQHFLNVLSTETNSFFKNTFKKLLFLCWESSPKIFTGN